MKSTLCEFFLELSKEFNKAIYVDQFLSSYLKVRPDDKVKHNLITSYQKARDANAWHLSYDSNVKTWKIVELWGQNKLRKVMTLKLKAAA